MSRLALVRRYTEGQSEPSDSLVINMLPATLSCLAGCLSKPSGDSIDFNRYTVIFKVAFSTFWFKFGATLRRQAERRDSGTRQKASNLAQPIS